jgi:GntR family transcriptional regulator
VLQPGELLPPEGELEQIYGVSRITVRRALADLNQAGLVEPRQGRGTYIRDPAEADAPCLVSFTETALASGDTPGSQLLGFERLRDDHPASDLLELEQTSPLHRMRRLRLLNGRPMFVSTAYLPVILFPALSAADVADHGPGQSLYAIVERAGVVLQEGEEGTCAIAADPDLADLFDLKLHSPVVQRTCLLRDETSRPALYEEAVWGVPLRTKVRFDPKK